MIGETVSHYKIIEKLGMGGMGVVYKAIDTTLERIVALKFVSSEVSDNESVIKRLAREAKACASLNHPNITTIYEFAMNDGRSFIVMEYVEGITLQELIAKKTLELNEVLDIAHQAVNGLIAAHKKGIVHRDLKSSNIMLDAEHCVKIMDFGLAKLASGTTMLTQSGEILGTAAYMSPEQVKGENVDLRSDIYSFGMILYQLSTGELPFKDEHQLAIMYSIIHENPVFPHEINSNINPDFEAVILKALEKDPNNRYESFAEMESDIRNLQSAHISGKKKSNSIRGDLSKRGFFYKSIILKYFLPFLLMLAGITWIINRDILHYKSKNLDPATARMHFESGMSYFRNAQHALAKREFELAVQEDSTYSVAWSSLAAVNIRMHELDSAISQSNRAIVLDSSNALAYYNLAYALEEKSEFDIALANYLKVVEIDSTFTLAYSALGNLYIKIDKPHQAIQLLKRALRLTPESDYLYLVYKNLGKAQLVMAQYDEAISLLKRSLELQPIEIPETSYYLAMAFEKAGMKSKSVAIWQHYIEIEPDTLKRKTAISHFQKYSK